MFWKTSKIMDRLDEMLESAIDGSFEEKNFSESRLSRLEAKMYHYLASGCTARKQLTAEKDAIKELVSDISHQTKTPLANIILYTQLLKEQGLDKESGALAAQIEQQAEKLNFLIELDRRGECDCVFYDCENQAFTDYISKFGFIESYGTFSDICELCPSWGVAGVNLSVGYKNEHTSSEILYTNPLLATIEKVKNILKDTSITEPFKYIPSTSWYYNSYYSAAMGSDYKGGGLDSFCRCAKCNGLAYKDETIDVIMLDGKIGQVCYDCLTKEVDWCSRCHKAYEVKDTCKNFVCNECLTAEKEKKGKQK